MNGKPLAMLALAVLCGLGAMYGTTRLLSKNRAQPVAEMQDVMVAAQDLKEEQILNKPELMKVVRMEKALVPPGSYSQAKDVEDRWVQTKILEGEPIVDRKLAVRGTPAGIVSRIPKGMRAFAIEVNEQTGVSGFVLPDHRVDVIQVELNTGGHHEAETVLQDVQVLAAGQTFSRADNNDRTVIARTVTLAVTEEQAEILVAAKSRGTLTLSLRPLNDHEQLVHKKKEPPPPPVQLPPPLPPPRYVWIYRSGREPEKARIGQPGEAVLDAPANAPPPQN
jgi:pilus assembly protein CpaB